MTGVHRKARAHERPEQARRRGTVDADDAQDAQKGAAVIPGVVAFHAPGLGA